MAKKLTEKQLAVLQKIAAAGRSGECMGIDRRVADGLKRRGLVTSKWHWTVCTYYITPAGLAALNQDAPEGYTMKEITAKYFPGMTDEPATTHPMTTAVPGWKPMTPESAIHQEQEFDFEERPAMPAIRNLPESEDERHERGQAAAFDVGDMVRVIATVYRGRTGTVVHAPPDRVNYIVKFDAPYINSKSMFHPGELELWQPEPESDTLRIENAKLLKSEQAYHEENERLRQVLMDLDRLAQESPIIGVGYDFLRQEVRVRVANALNNDGGDTAIQIQMNGAEG